MLLAFVYNFTSYWQPGDLQFLITCSMQNTEGEGLGVKWMFEQFHNTGDPSSFNTPTVASAQFPPPRPRDTLPTSWHLHITPIAWLHIAHARRTMPCICLVVNAITASCRTSHSIFHTAFWRACPQIPSLAEGVWQAGVANPFPPFSKAAARAASRVRPFITTLSSDSGFVSSSVSSVSASMSSMDETSGLVRETRMKRKAWRRETKSEEPAPTSISISLLQRLKIGCRDSRLVAVPIAIGSVIVSGRGFLFGAR